MDDKTLIQFDNVTFSYPHDEEDSYAPESPVLIDFSLKIPKGQFIAILGHNGSGKSTAAKMMNALLVPQSGKVTV